MSIDRSICVSCAYDYSLIQRLREGSHLRCCRSPCSRTDLACLSNGPASAPLNIVDAAQRWGTCLLAPSALWDGSALHAEVLALLTCKVVSSVGVIMQRERRQRDIMLQHSRSTAPHMLLGHLRALQRCSWHLMHVPATSCKPLHTPNALNIVARTAGLSPRFGLYSLSAPDSAPPAAGASQAGDSAASSGAKMMPWSTSSAS